MASRGVGSATFGIDPEIGIAVDVTPTGDTPASIKMVMELGMGPCVKFRDVGMIADPRVVDWMIQTAEKAKIPYQREVLLVGSTDAKEIQISRAGVMAGALSIPCRYIHSASEMVDINDMKNLVKLLMAMLSKNPVTSIRSLTTPTPTVPKTKSSEFQSRTLPETTSPSLSSTLWC